MKLWINGELTDIGGLTSVADLADQFGFHPHAVLIEHNAVALREREWPKQVLAEGDRIEFVRVVAGG